MLQTMQAKMLTVGPPMANSAFATLFMNLVFGEMCETFLLFLTLSVLSSFDSTVQDVKVQRVKRRKVNWFLGNLIYTENG